MSTDVIILEKMKTDLTNGLASYVMPFKQADNQNAGSEKGRSTIDITKKIGSDITISFTGRIFCTACNKQIKKAFGQGFCYPCFINSPDNAECIIRPELCRAHLGEGRDVEWEKKHHLQPHIVYLAWSSHYKVGITRKTQMPTRWIDQGAYMAAPIAECPNRYLSGCIEVALKSVLSDKTSWQRMLKFQPDMFMGTQEFEQTFQKVLADIPEQYQQFVMEKPNITSISYPVHHQLQKVKSIKLDKVPEIKETLVGIKGQYLIFKSDHVFNVRNHTGYEVHID